LFKNRTNAFRKKSQEIIAPVSTHSPLSLQPRNIFENIPFFTGEILNFKRPIISPSVRLVNGSRISWGFSDGCLILPAHAWASGSGGDI